MAKQLDELTKLTKEALGHVKVIDKIRGNSINLLDNIIFYFYTVGVYNLAGGNDLQYF